MPKLDLSVPHALGATEALRRISSIFTDLKKQYADEISDLTERSMPDGRYFSFKIRGMRIEGKLSVTAGEVTLNGSLPLMAAPFKGKIAQIVTDRARQLLA